jgi:lysophospholipase L1-like esterase
LLSHRLGGRFCVTHCEGKAGDSRRVIASLDRWLAAIPEAELVVLNCGLHDIKRDRESGQINVPLDEYRQNVRDAVARLVEAGKAIIWAQTTPVIYERHASKGFDRRNEDVVACNRAAEEIMTDAGVAVCRLYDEIRIAGPAEMLGPDGVHMTDAGSDRLAAALARAIQSRWTM